MESLDVYYAFTDDSGAILAGAGIAGDVLKCLAVSEEARSEGLLVPLVTRIISEHPGVNLKVFTKPEYRAVFESLGFRLIAQAPLAILLENGRGLEKYCEYLRSFRREGRCGVIVMNANPFTLGHQYLIEHAAAQVDTLFVIPVKEDVSEFPYAERHAMIKSGTEGPAAEKNQFSEADANPTRRGAVVVLDGSDYVISAATFPTYFLKDLSSVAETQMRLDLDLYQRWIAPALGASVRFVGSEPFDALTNQYNQLIPNAVVIPRLEMASAGLAAEKNYFSQGFAKNQFSSANANLTHADAISASAVRKALAAGWFKEAAMLCPVTTWPYLLAALAQRALCMELDTPCKPGLVGPDGSGAHKDMDYGIMLRGIRALRPFWSRMALAGTPEELRQLGIDAESAMMAATGGVNTHRGAIFALGLALNAFWTICRDVQSTDNQKNMQILLGNIATEVLRNQLKTKDLHIAPLVGARRMAADGYCELFEDWLPFYRSKKTEEEHRFSEASDSFCSAEGPVGFSGASAFFFATEKPTPAAEQKTLLRIMSTLDDTCVVHRVGEERAEQVKKEAGEIAGQVGNDATDRPGNDVSVMPDLIGHLCERYAAEGISPGGAADMLSLTIFIDSIL